MTTVVRGIASRTVRDIMRTQVVAVVPEMTVRELAQTLQEEEISGAPVLGPTGKILGVVSMTDVVRLASREAEIPSGQPSWEPVLLREEENSAAAEYGDEVRFTSPEPEFLAEHAFDGYRVQDIMTPVAFSVGPDDTIQEVLRFFLRGRVHRALVVDHGTLLGIVTPFDVLELLQDAME